MNGIEPGSHIGDSCFKAMTNQGKAQKIDRENQVIDSQFPCTNQIGKEYSVIEAKYSGEKTGERQNQSSGKNHFFVRHEEAPGKDGFF